MGAGEPLQVGYQLLAIGVAVSRWVSYHGLALNINTDLDYFKHINPCGITQFPVGSVSSVLGKDVNIAEVKEILASNFADYFGYEMKMIKDISELSTELAVA